MAEWSKAAVLKTVSGVTRSWVRIPVPPPALSLEGNGLHDPRDATDTCQGDASRAELQTDCKHAAASVRPNPRNAPVACCELPLQAGGCCSRRAREAGQPSHSGAHGAIETGRGRLSGVNRPDWSNGALGPPLLTLLEVLLDHAAVVGRIVPREELCWEVGELPPL